MPWSAVGGLRQGGTQQMVTCIEVPLIHCQPVGPWEASECALGPLAGPQMFGERGTLQKLLEKLLQASPPLGAHIHGKQ